jgi:hypothetical protein
MEAKRMAKARSKARKAHPHTKSATKAPAPTKHRSLPENSMKKPSKPAFPPSPTRTAQDGPSPGPTMLFTPYASQQPVFEVTAITMRDEPIYRHHQMTPFTDHQEMPRLFHEAIRARRAFNSARTVSWSRCRGTSAAKIFAEEHRLLMGPPKVTNMEVLAHKMPAERRSAAPSTVNKNHQPLLRALGKVASVGDLFVWLQSGWP